MEKRPSWDEYFLSVMREVTKRAGCDRGRAGSVIVKDNRILTTGYVGSPAGLKHCIDAGHMLKKSLDSDGNIKENCVRTIHSEQNAIAQAAQFGISIKGATIYTKMEPCISCAKLIIASGIKKVICEKLYQDAELTRGLFRDVGIELIVLDNTVEEY